MEELEKKSDWEDLARQLGATIPESSVPGSTVPGSTEDESATGASPTGESAATAASGSQADVVSPVRVPLPAAPPQAAPGDWDALVSDLGVAPPEPVAQPSQADSSADKSSDDSDSWPRDDLQVDPPSSVPPGPESTNPSDTEPTSSDHPDSGREFGEFGAGLVPAEELPGTDAKDDSWGLKSRGAPREAESTPPEHDVHSAWGTPAKADQDASPAPGETARDPDARDDEAESGGAASSAVKLWHSIFGRPKESAGWDSPSAPQGEEPVSRGFDEPSSTKTDADEEAKLESGAPDSSDNAEEETTERTRRPRRRSRSRRRRRGSSDTSARSAPDRDSRRDADGPSDVGDEKPARDFADGDLDDSEPADQDADGDADQTDRGRRRARPRRPAQAEDDTESDDDLDQDLDEQDSDDDPDDDSEDESGDARPKLKSGRRPAVHRNIPSWEDAVGTIIEANMQTRTQRKPSSTRSSSGGGRGRPRGRRRRT